MPTISVWDLFFVKDALYSFHYFKYFFLHVSYYFAQKNLFNDPPIEIFIISMKVDVLSFKENYITTMIVEGGWASGDNN